MRFPAPVAMRRLPNMCDAVAGVSVLPSHGRRARCTRHTGAIGPVGHCDYQRPQCRPDADGAFRSVIIHLRSGDAPCPAKEVALNADRRASAGSASGLGEPAGRSGADAGRPAVPFLGPGYSWHTGQPADHLGAAVRFATSRRTICLQLCARHAATAVFCAVTPNCSATMKRRISFCREGGVTLRPATHIAPPGESPDVTRPDHLR